MAEKAKVDLRVMFKGGDTPTSAQYSDLIDSQFNLVNNHQTISGINEFSGAQTFLGVATLSNANITLGNIQSAAATDAAFYILNGDRGEIRSQTQAAVGNQSGSFQLELRNTSITATSLIVANLIGGSDGALLTGSLLSANVISANTASLNFYNASGIDIPDNSIFTASFAVL
tara:strand:+ start:977 stop:1495 length:519 start_codon:yes stop_codon:yes gene_type:complete